MMSFALAVSAFSASATAATNYAVGIGISFVRTRKKLFYCGTVAALLLAITFHAIYNTLVLTDYRYCGLVLPVISYIPVSVYFIRQAKRKIMAV